MRVALARKKIDEFLNKIDEILILEVIEWRSIMNKTPEDNMPGGNKGEITGGGNGTTR